MSEEITENAGVVGLKLTCNDLLDMMTMVELSGVDVTGNSMHHFDNFLFIIKDKTVQIGVRTKDNALALKIELIKPIIVNGDGYIPVDFESYRKQLKKYEKTDLITVYYDSKENVITLSREHPQLNVSFEAISVTNIESTNRKPLPIKFDAEIPSFVRKRETVINAETGEPELDEKQQPITERIFEAWKCQINVEAKKLVGMIGDSEDSAFYFYPLVVKNKQLFCNSKNDKGTYKVDREIDIESIKFFDESESVESSFGANLSCLVSSIKSEKVKLYLSNNAPLLLVKDTKTYKLTAYLVVSNVVDTSVSHEEEINIEPVT